MVNMRSALVSFICVSVLVPQFSRAQLYDMSDGNDEGLVIPCPNGPNARWTEEDASNYPGGPTEGKVLTSSPSSSACLSTPTILVTKDSKFHIYVHVPYEVSWDSMIVWLVEAQCEQEPCHQYEWLKISGIVPEGQRWIEMSAPLPVDASAPADYRVEIWDMSSTDAVSIRYFEISEIDRTTTKTEPPTTTTTDPPTTTTQPTKITATDPPTTTTQPTKITATDPPTTTTQPTKITATDPPTTTTQPTKITATDPPTTTTQPTTTTPTKPPTTTTVPPAHGGLNGWGVLLGVVIGVILMSVIFCCWWLLLSAWRRRKHKKQDDEFHAPLPRLEVVSTPNGSYAGSRISIRGNWGFK